MNLNRAEALELLKSFTKNENLIKHMFAVEAAMRVYAKHFHEDEDWWGIVGLLHDFDYEQYPSAAEHPYKGSEILREKGYPEEFVKTILAHASHSGEPRDTLAKKAIYAVDELTGLIVATALVKPGKKLAEVDVRSVKKKMKNKAFARQIDRDEIEKGAVELGIALDDHIEMVLQAMKNISNTLRL